MHYDLASVVSKFDPRHPVVCGHVTPGPCWTDSRVDGLWDTVLASYTQLRAVELQYIQHLEAPLEWPIVPRGNASARSVTAEQERVLALSHKAGVWSEDMEEWVVEGERMRARSTEEYCGRMPGAMVFVGDSIMRYFCPV